ncbi:minor teichoic acid biosynthesis protein GgaB [Ligilactobacillus salitolerans]|uniref:Minor teichoic acid biosynthesis protein GgaB n=1 Tax=Ligilactobacillus salitolerans TaxID=1808352 RepID=A0A401ISP1_9LACO|nr:CDP-glycerol glycerophosphotransferase family protein [Ligilactobacillus salitolerans]GBG94549.1 minor teichoic acid biosynthesis protein GgaB [Ligilactobacillus salitolerans]
MESLELIKIPDVEKSNEVAQEEVSGKYSRNEFFFSIIMATYNVDRYIDEAMDSLIKQQLNFEKNVQVIIVNDGSSDKSLEKAEAWKEKYPNNIVVIDQENSGVSVARNAGIEVAKGKYINFLDPDDMLDDGVLLRVKWFFMKHPDIKISHIPLYTFEAKSEPHNLNKYFDKDEEIVDIAKTSKKIFAHISSSFFLRTLFADTSLRFEVGRKYGEDFALVAKLVEQEKKFALINNFFYRYRARSAGDSAMDSSRSDSATYIPNIKMMLELARTHEKDGRIDKWLQNMLVYDLAWKVRRQELPFEGSAEFYTEYLDLVSELLQYIDENEIRAVGHLRWVQKEALVHLKNSGDLPLQDKAVGLPVCLKDDVHLINGEKTYYLSNVISKVYVFKYRPETNSINIIGTIDHLFGKEFLNVTATDGKQIFVSEELDEPARVKMIGLPVHSMYTYSFSIPIKSLTDSKYLQIQINFKKVRIPLKIEFGGILVGVGNNIKFNYLWANQKLLRFNFNDNYFEVRDNNLENLSRFENDLTAKFISSKGMTQARKERLLYLRKLALKSKTSNKIINIFEDRANKADDNAEVFYKYINERHPEWENYFVLNRDSSDWDRLEQENYRLVEYGSEEHEELLIQAQNLISSQASLTEMRPWQENFGYLRDAYHYNFIFLQHGVTKQDLSLWLRKIEKDIRLLVTVSEQEQQGFFGYGYEYGPEEVKVTGFPRFDRFKVDYSISKNQGNILIAPTWRNGIWNDKDKLEDKIKKLHDTEFYQKWEDFLKSDYLKELIEQGHTISLMLHPLLREVETGFEVPKYIEKVPFEQRYVNVLKKADLLITDYSSIYFDIAYQGKPTLYFQFDGGNTNNKEGYFDFQEMGFGPVCDDFNKVIFELSRIIKNNYQMTDLYKNRVLDFFRYTDTKNSNRLENELTKMINKMLLVRKETSINYSEQSIDQIYQETKIQRDGFLSSVYKKLRKYVKQKASEGSVSYNLALKIYRRVV